MQNQVFNKLSNESLKKHHSYINFNEICSNLTLSKEEVFYYKNYFNSLLSKNISFKSIDFLNFLQNYNQSKKSICQKCTSSTDLNCECQKTCRELFVNNINEIIDDLETSEDDKIFLLKILDEIDKSRMPTEKQFLELELESQLPEDYLIENNHVEIENNSKAEYQFNNLRETLNPEEFLKLKSEEKEKKLRKKNEKYLKKLTIFNWRKNMATKTGYIYLKNNSNQFKLEEKRKNEQLNSDLKNLELSEILKKIEKEKKLIKSEEKKFRGYRDLNRHDRHLMDKVLKETMENIFFNKFKVEKNWEFKFDKESPTIYLTSSFYYEKPFEKNMATKTGYIYLKNNSNQFKLEEKRKNEQFEKERIFEKKYYYRFDCKNASYESISKAFVIAQIINQDQNKLLDVLFSEGSRSFKKEIKKIVKMVNCSFKWYVSSNKVANFGKRARSKKWQTIQNNASIHFLLMTGGMGMKTDYNPVVDLDFHKFDEKFRAILWKKFTMFLNKWKIGFYVTSKHGSPHIVFTSSVKFKSCKIYYLGKETNYQRIEIGDFIANGQAITSHFNKGRGMEFTKWWDDSDAITQQRISLESVKQRNDLFSVVGFSFSSNEIVEDKDFITENDFKSDNKDFKMNNQDKSYKKITFKDIKIEKIVKFKKEVKMNINNSTVSRECLFASVSFKDSSNKSNYFLINGGKTFDKSGLEKLENAWKNNKKFDMNLLQGYSQKFYGKVNLV